jgi:CubicO group peptidase (beta-lactamase class C family)
MLSRCSAVWSCFNLGAVGQLDRRGRPGLWLVAAAMLASCSDSGDGATNAEPGDVAGSSGTVSESQVVTAPGVGTGVASTSGPSSTDAPIDEALAAVSAHAEEFADSDRFSGAMLVSHDGEILFEDTWGFADREAGTPNTSDTKFRIGSMNKMFTAVAILQLVRGGQAGAGRSDRQVPHRLPE